MTMTREGGENTLTHKQDDNNQLNLHKMMNDFVNENYSGGNTLALKAFEKRPI